MKKIKNLFKAKTNINEIYKENKEIFDNIKKLLINSEEKTVKFFKNFKGYFEIGENKDLIGDLFLLFNSKKYEMDLKSIIFFFKSFGKGDEWNKNLSNKYEK